VSALFCFGSRLFFRVGRVLAFGQFAISYASVCVGTVVLFFHYFALIPQPPGAVFLYFLAPFRMLLVFGFGVYQYI